MSELGEEIYDWENDELKKVFDYSKCDYTNPNILFIENFEFNPDYKIQSWLLGSIKDILYKFDNMFGIMIINVSPVENIEFCTINNVDNATKTKFENYNSKTEKRKTFEELSEICKQLEFKQINKSNYYYYMPTVLNKSLQSIKIDYKILHV